MSNHPVWECWVAYHLDYSGIVVFVSEIDALRYAVSNGMQVKRLENGEELC